MYVHKNIIVISKDHNYPICCSRQWLNNYWRSAMPCQNKKTDAYAKPKCKKNIHFILEISCVKMI